MTPPANWTILRVVHPTSSNIKLPEEVASLLGFTPEVYRLEKPARALAFLNRGHEMLRAVSAYRAGDLYNKELAQNHVVAITFVSGPNGLFYLPDAVERFLGLELYQAASQGKTGTDESLAWVAPAEEVLAFRKTQRMGKRFRLSEETVHVYLRKATLRGWLPPVETVEVSRTPIPGVVTPVRSPASAR